MTSRKQIQDLLVSLNEEGASQDQAMLCLVEKVVEALREPTPEMCEAGEYDDNGPPGESHYITFYDAEGVWNRMFAARFGERG